MTESSPPDEVPTDPAVRLAGRGPASDEVEFALLQRDIRAKIFGSPSRVEIGGYVLSHRLGAGGLGVVYAARDPRLERDVALKLVLPGHSRGQARMLGEARALAKLAHPNVVAIHEVGTHGDRVFVAMELVEGKTIREWLAAPRSLAEIAGVFAQAGEGLAAAHRAGLVHRDFKPDNAIIGDDPRSVRAYGRVRVVDFGLARPAADVEVSIPDGADDTSTAGTGGTPAYMALEQIEGGEIDARADLFAFCGSLYEALHGERPFGGATKAALVLALERGPAALAFRRDLPRRLVSLVRSGLAARAEDRSASLDSIIAELHRIESPPRRGMLFAAVGVAAIGIGAAAFANVRADDEPVAGVVPTSAVASVRALDNICPPATEPDPRSCGELEARLMVEGRVDDWEARCAYRRACAAPDPVCPDGTVWNGSVGCSLLACAAASDDDAIARCESGDTTCCLRSANVRYELGPDDAGKARIAHELARACSAGDAHACLGVASVGRKFGSDEASVVAALVGACHLGHLQACRRIAVLPEEREGLRPECTDRPDDTCPAIETNPVQLVHMAACRTVAMELPSFFVENGAPSSKAIAAADIPLADGEAEAIDRAEARVVADLAGEFRSFLRDLGETDDVDALALPELVRRVEDRVLGHADYAQVQIAMQKIADARAALVPARPATVSSSADRLFTLQASAGARLEDEIAAELGRERAVALHRELWPGAEVLRQQGSCPD